MALRARSRTRPSVRPRKTGTPGGALAAHTAQARAILLARWRVVRARHTAMRAVGLRRAPGERILMARHEPRGVHVVATDRALCYRTGEQPWQRLGWEHITQVTWDAETSHFVVTGLAGVAPARTELPLSDGGDLAWLAQERVAATRIASQRVMLGSGHRAWAEARRRPGTDELCWLVTLDDGLDPAGQEVRSQVESALTALREILGLADLFSEDCYLISGTDALPVPGPRGLQPPPLSHLYQQGTE